MSVYTTITLTEANDWLSKHYAMESAFDLIPIAEGTVNSNYHLHTSSGRYILTLFETLEPPQLQSVLVLTQFLKKQGLKCPQPIPTRSGALWSLFHNKPAALIEFLQGHNVFTPDKVHCKAIGAWLAEMHRCTQHYPPFLPNPMGLEWRTETLQKVKPLLSSDERVTLNRVLERTETLPLAELRTGVIHADLFRDNALFQNDVLQGVIDFYFACRDHLLYDLAILLNDWCYQDGVWHADRMDACLDAYQAVFPLPLLEQRVLPDMLLLAGLRFWLSRLHSQFFPRSGSQVLKKNPDEMRQLLLLLLKNNPVHFRQT